ncbi:MAG: presqualene diphosphate synthase HpnD [Vicinamibacteria bacterium]|nr:presqualene diphosphate synthase HpnD [Vicinamibacteria bacterium]
MSYSEQLTRKSGTTFYYAFRILPRAKREAIYALYAFCRAVDDCVDEPDGGGEAGLQMWTAEVDRCFTGRATTDIGRDLAQALARFPMPRAALLDIIAGCRMDLLVNRYASFDDLRVYCLRVASAVGLATIEIFGYRNPRTREFALELGLALQLTNILRDIAADARRDRLYIPQDELQRFGVEEGELLNAERHTHPSTPVRALLAHQAERARAHYERAASLLPREDRRSLLCARLMGNLYRAILIEIENRGCPIGEPRVRLSTGRKLWIALKTVAGG